MGRHRRRICARAAVVLVGAASVVAAGTSGPVPRAGAVDSGTASLSGTVLDDSSVPQVAVSGVTVCLHDDGGQRCTTTGGAGLYTFAGVASGPYTLTATPPVGSFYVPVGVSPAGGTPALPAIRVDVSGSHHQDILLSLGGRLAVTVNQPDGTPAAGEPVAVCRTDAAGEPGACPGTIALPSTDRSGDAPLDPLPPGAYQVTAGRDDGGPGYPVTVSVPFLQQELTVPVTLSLVPGGSLSGSVQDDGGAPVPGATLSIALPGGVTKEATTAKDGRYSFPSLKPGTYSGRVVPPSGAPYEGVDAGSIEIGAGADVVRDFVVPRTVPVGDYDFSGFLAPVPGTGPAKAGSTLPVRWRLRVNGDPVTDPASFVGMSSAPCGGGAAEPAHSPGSSGLQGAGDGLWRVSWKTAKAWAGQCRTLTLELVDGPHAVDVQFK